MIKNQDRRVVKGPIKRGLQEPVHKKESAQRYFPYPTLTGPGTGKTQDRSFPLQGYKGILSCFLLALLLFLSFWYLFAVSFSLLLLVFVFKLDALRISLGVHYQARYRYEIISHIFPIFILKRGSFIPLSLLTGYYYINQIY